MKSNDLFKGKDIYYDKSILIIPFLFWLSDKLIYFLFSIQLKLVWSLYYIANRLYIKQMITKPFCKKEMEIWSIGSHRLNDNIITHRIKTLPLYCEIRLSALNLNAGNPHHNVRSPNIRSRNTDPQNVFRHRIGRNWNSEIRIVFAHQDRRDPRPGLSGGTASRVPQGCSPSRGTSR